MKAARTIPFSVVLLLFLVSGASGLTYEVIWTRRLTLVFGSGLFATSTVLATFMGGLALGSWWLGKSTDRRTDPLGFYGWLEIGIGVYALVLPFILRATIPAYQAAYRASDGHMPIVNATRLSLSAAVFLVPTLLMGGTLPALARFAARGSADLGLRVGRLYAINTWGAVLGTLAAGFLLIEWLGLRGAEVVTAAANLAVGVLAVALGRRSPVRDEAPAPVRDGARAAQEPPRGRTLVLVALALSGFAALGYEVVWVRFLTFFFGNSTYAFATMLATFLAGLALGALVASRYVDGLKNPFATFAGLEWLIGLTMALGLVAYPYSPNVYHAVSNLVPGHSWGEWILVRFAMAFGVLFVPTLLLGAAFPLACRLYVAGPRRVGSEVGALYAANTVGAILGSLAAGFVLVPWVGFRGAVVLLVGLNAVVAAMLAMRAGRRRTVLVAASAALAAGAFVGLPREVFLSTVQRSFPGQEIVYYREHPSATVFVTRSPENERWVHFSDKRASGGTMNLPGHRFWGHLPSLLAERRESALVICFGSGITLGSVATHPFERITCAEICEGIREPARFFPENHGVLDDQRVKLVSDDGRNVLLGSPATYDVIVSEPPLLETAGVVNLFTREFYELVKSRLAPGGVFCQWVPSFEFDHDQHALILRTFLRVFPDATFWGSPLYADTMLIATNGPPRFDLEEIARRVAEPGVARDLRESGVAGAAEVLGYFGRSAAGLERYCGDGPLLTDDRTILDFVMPRSVIRPTGYRPVTLWKRRLAVPPHVLAMQAGESVLPLLGPPSGDGADRHAAIARIERSKRALIAGHIAGVRGHPKERSTLYEEAYRIAPDYTNARYYVAVERIERAEQAAESGNRSAAAELAVSAREPAAVFDHLRRRLVLLPDDSPDAAAAGVR